MTTVRKHPSEKRRKQIKPTKLAITKQIVQFLIVADGELVMAREDTLLFVTASGISSQFEDFGGEVFDNCSEQPVCVTQCSVKVYKPHFPLQSEYSAYSESGEAYIDKIK
jgi:hypothetical protein